MYRNVWPSRRSTCQRRSGSQHKATALALSSRLLAAASMLSVLRSVRVPASRGTGWGDLVGRRVPVGGEASVTQHRLAEPACPRHAPLQSPPMCRGPTAQGWKVSAWKEEPSSLTAEAVCAHLEHRRWLGHAPATLSSREFGSGGVQRAACSWARRGPSPC